LRSEPQQTRNRFKLARFDGAWDGKLMLGGRVMMMKKVVLPWRQCQGSFEHLYSAFE
jgi:hypothetical protein